MSRKNARHWVGLVTNSILRPSLGNQHFDVAVIGGGINGVAIARECARGGLRTLLLEQHDFASGTTSRSTRIIHGGLRYLEHGDLAQVRESLRERQRLLAEYPHLVHRMEFLLALPAASRRSGLGVRAGLWLYRRIGGHSNNGDRNEARRLEQMLDEGGAHFSIFSFDDAQCEFPERMVALWMLEGAAAGCEVRNHTEVLSVEVSQGKVTGLRLRDSLRQTEDTARATWVINATGPWADEVCRRSSIRTDRAMIGGVRGSHIVLPLFTGAPTAAVYSEAIDGRPFFTIPWNEQLLVGTTEVGDTTDPGRVQPSPEEIAYLLRSAQRLYPRVQISGADVRFAFAGVRPLPYSPGANLAKLSRRHYLHDHSADGAAGMLSVIGGKLTTAASLARECAAKIGVPTSTMQISLAEAKNVDALMAREIDRVTQAGSVSQETARGLVEWFGATAMTIARSAKERPELREPLCPHTTHVVGEAIHGMTGEYAFTLGDVLLRRVPVALGGCWSAECGRFASERIGAAMGWDEHQIAASREAFEEERAAFLKKPSPQSGY